MLTMPAENYRTKLIGEDKQSHQNQITHLETENAKLPANKKAIRRRGSIYTEKVHLKQFLLFSGYEI